VNPIELALSLVLAVLLIAAFGGEPGTMQVVADGSHEFESGPDALVVAGGTATVPANASVDGSVYAVGGTLAVNGTVEGDVVQVGANVSVGSGGTVTGVLRVLAGDPAVAEGATVGRLDRLEPITAERSPVGAVAARLLQWLAVAALAAGVARRRPDLLDTVAAAATDHPVVSGVVGALTGTTALALVVFMALTLVLIPVSLLGVLGGVASVAYAYAAFGHLIGRRLPVGRPDLAAAAGSVLVMVALDLLGRVPLLGGTLQLALTAVGVGAVLVTYLGFSRFEPVELPA
jgi:hypothetical protein